MLFLTLEYRRKLSILLTKGRKLGRGGESADFVVTPYDAAVKIFQAPVIYGVFS